MISKNEVKYIQSLYHKKTREATGLFIAEGVKLVDELLASTDHSIQKIYALKEWSRDTSVPVIIIEAHELEKISNLATPNTVLAIAMQKQLKATPVLENQITLALDGIQDPGNLGTIIRIADWFGISQIIAGTDTADLYNPKVIQASMGSVLRVNVWYQPLDDMLAQTSVPVYGALLHGKSIYATSKIKEGIILIGNESKGIRQNLLSFVKEAITIPSKGSAESLNAAVATGIILSHLLE